MLSGQARLNGYVAAGEHFLADRIADMFQPIKSPEQQALHNAILEEVTSMIEGNEKVFFQHLANKMLNQKRKTWIQKVAETIILVGRK